MRAMRIGVVGSLQFAEKLLEVRNQLNELGHDAYVSDLIEPFVGLTEEARTKLDQEQKQNDDVIREFWKKMHGGDALLVVNVTKRGIEHYIGGNAFLEMGFAHVLGQKIFLWNPIPEIPNYQFEMEAMRPVVINGDLEKIY